jgi:hypothetical protein
MNSLIYKEKYLKYKNKYFNLRNKMIGGSSSDEGSKLYKVTNDQQIKYLYFKNYDNLEYLEDSLIPDKYSKLSDDIKKYYKLDTNTNKHIIDVSKIDKTVEIEIINGFTKSIKFNILYSGTFTQLPVSENEPLTSKGIKNYIKQFYKNNDKVNVLFKHLF